MKLFKEGLVRIDCGSAFHNFEAEYEKERSYNAVRDLGTERSPFSDDLKERVWVSDTGLSRPDIYAGAKITLIKLTRHDETKKRAHDSQIIRAKENIKLSHGLRIYGILRAYTSTEWSTTATSYEQRNTTHRATVLINQTCQANVKTVLSRSISFLSVQKLK